MTERPTLAIGLMSGTSLDGMDAALVRFHGPTHADLIDFVTRPYTDDERAELRRALAGGDAPSLARLHVRLGDWAAEAVETVLVQARVPASELALIAFHGQTIWHEPPTVTWQLGEPAVLAERFGVRVVSNFRARDLAAGGQGAPLVPMADVLLFASPDAPRVLLNLGGGP
jgi:anhydro-N-acetylmuramic acid kinase